ncbi:flavin reductase (DIM6/NTAB) family NADH-FMN oxidoreductase RutF [Streptacidiphilus sp. MAP12-33]|uniref:flavin reductase family protein n=1 Tax=Streptacidiphilus sp. MAP12-33 TaxID=3156266 RepID=UPI003516DE58
MPTNDLLESPAAVETEVFRRAVSQLPTGVCVVTAHGDAGPVGCTVNAVMSLSVHPPSLVVSLGAAGTTAAQVVGAGRFAVNVLAYRDRALVPKFAIGPMQDRFAGVDWHTAAGAPVLSGSSVAFVCEVTDVVCVLDHALVVGKVLWTREGAAVPTVLYRRDQYLLHG